MVELKLRHPRISSHGVPGPPRQIIVLGNPASRRVRLFADAARRYAPIQTVSYLDWLRGSETARPGPGSLVRIESPSECGETFREILRAGVIPLQNRGRVPVRDAEIADMVLGRGEILHPLQWYLGFRQILGRLDADWGPRGVRWMTPPATIAQTFDKLDCLNRWSAAGLPVPRRYENVSTYAQLRESVPDRHARLFVKLRYGYSAMGAMALEWRDSRIRALTTVDATWANGRPRLFVTKKPRTLHREFEIAWFVDTLAMEEIVVENWLPKARWHGRPFDLRVVMINQKAYHLVGRATSSPFTNLNLDATRIGRQQVIDDLGSAWPTAQSLCEQAASCFPNATTLGIDLLVKPCRRKFAILEANAFGDYLPGLEFAGKSTYEAQLDAVMRPKLEPEASVARSAVADEETNHSIRNEDP